MKPNLVYAKLIRATIVLPLLIHTVLAPIVVVPSPPPEHTEGNRGNISGDSTSAVHNPIIGAACFPGISEPLIRP